MSARRGFSLIEVLICIALLSGLLSMAFTFGADLMASRDHAKDYSEKQLASSILIDRLEADLLTAIAGDSRSGAGVAGDETSLTVLSRGVAAHVSDQGHAASTFSDLQKTEYRFDESSRVIEARRSVVARGAASSSKFWPIGRVAHVQFRYHDGIEWRESFDSMRAGGLPQAIEVAIWFEKWPGEVDDDESDSAEIPERLTFDATDVFDEDEFALRTEEMLMSAPRPDRIRVIVIPDAAPAGSSAAGDALAGGAS